jgi:WD40 repeat protein
MSLGRQTLLACVLLGSIPALRSHSRPADEAEIAALIKQLGSDDFEDREKASRRLEEIGAPAFEALRRASKRHADAEVRSRAGNIVKALRPQLFGAVRTLEGHAGQVNCFAISADGKRLISGSLDGTARLWDLEAGIEIERVSEQPEAVWAVAISRDGKRALFSLGMKQVNGEWTPITDHAIRYWDLEKHKLIRLLSGHTEDIRSLTFTADGRRALSAARDMTLRLWDLETGEEIRRFEGHTGIVRHAALSPDGRWVASSSLDHTVRCWDVETGEELSRFTGHEADVHGVAFTPDGTGIVSGGTDKMVRLSDALTGQEIRRFEGHTAVIWPVAVSPDGRYVLSAGGLRNRTPVFYEPAGFDSEVRLWDLGTGEELHRYDGHTGCLIMVRFAPDGRVVSAASDQTIRVWDMKLPRGK